MPIRVDGVDRVLKAMKARSEGDRINIVEGLDKAGKIVLKLAKKYVPKDTLALEKSGREETTGTGLGAKGIVEFGGPEAPYAFIVHERLEVYHEPPTCAKYLERAVRESRGTITAMLKRQFTSGTTRANTGGG